MLSEIEKNKACPDGRSYRPAEVSSSSGTSVRMLSTLCLMSHSEFRRYMGTHSRAKDPACPRVQLRSMKGEVTEYFVFKAGDAKDALWHRRLELSTFLCTQMKEGVLHEQDHMHRAQAENTVAHVGSELLSASSVDGLIGAQSWSTFSTMKEYKDPGMGSSQGARCCVSAGEVVKSFTFLAIGICACSAASCKSVYFMAVSLRRGWSGWAWRHSCRNLIWSSSFLYV